MRRDIICAAVLAVLATTGYTATIVVDAGGGADAATIGEAVAIANANSEADEIVVKAGTYIENNDPNAGLLEFGGSDEIVVRGEQPGSQPIVVLKPNLSEDLENPGNGDGIKIRMSGALTLQDLIIIPHEDLLFTEGLTDVDMISVDNTNTGGGPNALSLTLRNVVISDGTQDNQPVTTTGWDDPRIEAEFNNTFRDDAISVFTDGDDASGTPADVLTMVLDNVIITGYGSDTADGPDLLVLDGPEVDCTITGGSRLTFARRRGIFNFNSKKLTVDGTDDNPVIVYGVGETLARASGGENVWNHLWCIGIEEDEFAGTTGWACRIDPNRGATVTATNCIFSTALNDGMFMNSDSDGPLNYELRNCTFHNVPQLIRFGFVGAPGPSQNVTMNVVDCVIDNADWTAPNDGTYFSPEPTVVHYGDGDNTLAQLNITNLAYRTQTLVSSMSASRAPDTAGNVFEVDDFMFETTAFNPSDFSNFLVATNCDALGQMATGGAALVGARPSPCFVDVTHWAIY